MTWFIRDLPRLEAERRALDSLRADATWFTGLDWRLDGSAIVVHVDLDVGGEIYELVLRYPHVFPACPPSVRPRDPEEFWSHHQYGRGGELCLEYGPDNWHPDITGADLIESAYRLLDAERPRTAARPIMAVPSRHLLTPGQQLRSTYGRFVVGEELRARLAAIPTGATAAVEATMVLLADACTAVLTSVTGVDGVPWIDPDVPARALMRNGYSRQGVAVRLPPTVARPSTSSRDNLLAALTGAGIPPPGGGTLLPDDGVLVLVHDTEEPVLVVSYGAGDDNIDAHRTVATMASGADRLAPEHATLADKRVGIVGAGSVGSKIATSLARSGVGRFLLVDEDILLPGNLVRHDLDWTSVGGHKASELAWRLRVVRPSTVTAVRCIMLTGQEANSGVAAALDDLAACDLVVDATADGRVFGMIGAVAAARRLPMVWAEVFEGGVGGLVARHRPEHEPSPVTMRSRILAWCAAQGAPWEGGGTDYSRTGSDGQPLVASDADVSVIAAHAARFVLDTLLSRVPSEFPRAFRPRTGRPRGLLPSPIFFASSERFSAYFGATIG